MQLNTREENIRFAKSVKRVIYRYHFSPESFIELDQPKGKFIAQLEALEENTPFKSTLVDAETLCLGDLVRR